ncbi:hypothetical protein BFP78_03255 [Gaetbulibacter sp. 5U11]|nr:hypothetical protein BFP78_03255 [Gaetbulibacter sp. 5U11]
MKKNNTAILISSYDGFNELWKPLEASFKKYWPDNPYNVYITSNHLEPEFDTFKLLKIGNESSWSDNIIKSLNMIEEDYIILSHVDLFLNTKIDTKQVEFFVNETRKNNWDYLRLHPSPKGTTNISNRIAKIAPGSRYRASTVFPIIRKDVFLELLDINESAWQFEVNASSRSNSFENFYVSREVVIPYTNAIVKAKWVPSAYKSLKKEGFVTGLGKYPLMSNYEALKEKALRLRLKIFFFLIPVKYQNKVSKFVKKFI